MNSIAKRLPLLGRRWLSSQGRDSVDYRAFEAKVPPNFKPEKMMETHVSCTVFNEKGDVLAMSKRIPKTKLLAENDLHPRDLRSIDRPGVKALPSILVRENCILTSMLDVRAIITYNRVILLDAITNPANPKLMSKFIFDLRNKLQDTSGCKDQDKDKNQDNQEPKEVGVPYEMRALEAISMHTVQCLEVELKSHLKRLNEILEDLEDHVDRDLLQELLIRHKDLTKFYHSALLLRNIYSSTLDSDEDLAEMYLTEKQQGKHRDLENHAETEVMLESYYAQCNEIVQQVEQVTSNIRTTEEIINIMLDSNRNSLILMELNITIGTLSFTFAMFLASLFGMNLENFIEETNYGFGLVTVAISALTILFTWFNMRTLAVLRHITMGRRMSMYHHLPTYPAGSGSLNRKRTRGVLWNWLVQR